ncbi:calcium uptake protein, mitochondrial-like [Rutidosis leptorrhynchoides]|uniref:calcium uptake protein, mitochondrial-like n=1 Tax=Rutidosis leptorrhynchoides TaxID=125765 RepID=UPI003A992B1E
MFLFGDALRKKVFFNYEKRLRLHSPPEKIFEYFATFQSADGEVLMKPSDLMRAVVPVFPPSESSLVRDGFLKGERSPGELRSAPSKFFDVANGGLISFKEYIFFVTLLAIPESCFSVAFKMFDTDNDREINRDEFKKVMALMRAHNRQGASHRNGRSRGLKANGSVEDGGSLDYFFGKGGKARLHHETFIQFMKDLHDEILRLEFAHYDYNSQGKISAKDFALSIIAAADSSYLNELFKRVERLNSDPHLSEVRITLEEFKQFAELRDKLRPFSFALSGYGKVNGFLTREDFKRVASHVCGVSLTDSVVEIIFNIFDKNRDGSLNIDEFVKVLHKQQRDIPQPVASGIMGFLSQYRK